MQRRHASRRLAVRRAILVAVSVQHPAEPSSDRCASRPTRQVSPPRRLLSRYRACVPRFRLCRPDRLESPAVGPLWQFGALSARDPWHVKSPAMCPLSWFGALSTSPHGASRARLCALWGHLGALRANDHSTSRAWPCALSRGLMPEMLAGSRWSRSLVRSLGSCRPRCICPSTTFPCSLVRRQVRCAGERHVPRARRSGALAPGLLMRRAPRCDPRWSRLLAWSLDARRCG